MLPTTYRRLMATYISTEFTKCTRVETVPMVDVAALKPTEVLVRNHYAGINASDINYTAGKYRPNVAPPFATGMEAIGEVVAVGRKPETAVSAQQPSLVAVGTPVITQEFGAFAEYQVVPLRSLRVVPRVDPRLLAIEISGTTASIALEHVGVPVKGETALVTAAAGGTGAFAVQLLKKQYGCHVIGTCSGGAKADFLRRLGCDDVIDYTRDDVGEVLRRRKGGLNLVYESVGGAMLGLALEHVAIRGRIITIGGITGYASGADWAAPGESSKIPQQLLSKSASLRGFFLPHFKKLHEEHFRRLLDMVDRGDIDSCVDGSASFHGIDQIADAVAHLHGKKNMGKVVVRLV